MIPHTSLFFFFFNDTATTEIYTLSLHDALPIFSVFSTPPKMQPVGSSGPISGVRSEEHTSELQSLAYLVWRPLLEKKENSDLCVTCPQWDRHRGVRRRVTIAA